MGIMWLLIPRATYKPSGQRPSAYSAFGELMDSTRQNFEISPSRIGVGRGHYPQSTVIGRYTII